MVLLEVVVKSLALHCKLIKLVDLDISNMSVDFIPLRLNSVATDMDSWILWVVNFEFLDSIDLGNDLFVLES